MFKFKFSLSLITVNSIVSPGFVFSFKKLTNPLNEFTFNDLESFFIKVIISPEVFSLLPESPEFPDGPSGST